MYPEIKNPNLHYDRFHVTHNITLNQPITNQENTVINTLKLDTNPGPGIHIKFIHFHS